MNILLSSHYFSPSTGGVERVVESLARGFSGRGHRVTVVTETPAGRFDDTVFPFRVFRQPKVIALVRLIRKHDVIHLAGPALLPMFMAWLFGKPTIIEHHTYQAVCPNGLLLYEPPKTVCPGHFQAGRHRECLRCNRSAGRWTSWRMWMLTFPRVWLCRRAVANVAISQHVRRRLGLPKTEVIYHGLPVTAPIARDESATIDRKASVCFAYVGRLIEGKGLRVLIDAAVRLKDKGHPFRLKFIGDGPKRAQLEGYVTARGLDDRTQFTGMLHGENLERAVADVTAMVMPSILEETAGMAAIEQMMRGRVVIASDIGGLGEVVDVAGMKFPPGDTEALADCMGTVIEEPGLVRALGEKARQRARSLFLLDRRIDQHLELCRLLVKRSA